jgi:hypothetical protein
MARLYSDAAYLEIDGQVLECNSITWKASAAQNVVAPMNRLNRGTGYVNGRPTFELTIVVPHPQDGMDVDLWKVFRDEVTFTAVVEYRGGQSYVFSDCKIKDMDVSASQGNPVDWNLSVDALDMAAN